MAWVLYCDSRHSGNYVIEEHYATQFYANTQDTPSAPSFTDAKPANLVRPDLESSARSNFPLREHPAK